MFRHPPGQKPREVAFDSLAQKFTALVGFQHDGVAFCFVEGEDPGDGSKGGRVEGVDEVCECDGVVDSGYCSESCAGV